MGVKTIKTFYSGTIAIRGKVEHWAQFQVQKIKVGIYNPGAGWGLGGWKVTRRHQQEGKFFLNLT